MANDIFNRKPINNIDVHKAENMGLQFSGDAFTGDGLVYVQQISAAYSQRISRLFDLRRADAMLYVSARPEGSLNIVHAVSDAVSTTSMIAKFADVCKASSNVITMQAPPSGNCDSVSFKDVMTFHNCILVNMGFSQSIQDYVISDNLGIMFSHISK